MTEDRGGGRKLSQRSLCRPWLRKHRRLDDVVRKMIRRRHSVHGKLSQLTDGERRALVKQLTELPRLSGGELPSSARIHTIVLPADTRIMKGNMLVVRMETLAAWLWRQVEVYALNMSMQPR